MKKFVNILSHVIFWNWNLTFLTLVYVGILPYIGVELLQAIFNGEIQTEFLIPLLGLLIVPVICTLIGAIFLLKRPLELLRLFYGVEAPLILLCLLRLFILRELTAPSFLLLGTFVVCIVAFSIEIFKGFDRQRSAVAWVQMLTHSLMPIVGLYVGILALFYVVPTAAWMFAAFFSFGWLRDLISMLQYSPVGTIFWGLVSMFFFAISLTLFLGMPSLFAALYLKSARIIGKAFAVSYGKNRAIQVFLGVLTAWIIIFVGLQPQPQTYALKLLANPPQTDRERQELLDKSEQIKTGLVNAYLYAYRYLGTVAESNQIEAIYRDTFGFPKQINQALQNSFNWLLSPFLYQGSASDSDRSEKLYAEFFDTPLQKGENKAVQHALKSTAIVDDAKAGLLNLNQEKVWLKQQKVTVKERGDWADVELYEVYENQTFDVEEIFYSFSLPESAVITGLWLGDTNDLSKRFPFQVSPRGAAQKVYNAQVRRERPVDPALLEQVGPRHYRLRAFPVPPRLTAWQQENGTQTQRPTQMHLWLTYKVMKDEKGWELPHLGEKRNIFWTDKTNRTYNEKTVGNLGENWLPEFIPATQSAPPQLHQVDFSEGYRLSAKPLQESDYVLPQGKQFALIVDTSRSMASHREELVKAFNWLKQKGFSDTDVYVTATAGTKPERLADLKQFQPEKKVFYGTLQLKEMLGQFKQLAGNTTYDGILLVTDEGSYELSDDKQDVADLSAPLWLVHLGSLPAAYDDKMVAAIQKSGGGVSTELPEALQRIATKAALGSTVVSVVDGYAWSIEPTTAQALPQKEFEPIAARMLIQGLSQLKNSEGLMQLDLMHSIAKTYEVVTPYSSMIVLVNDEQRKALKQAEASTDRFDRQVEDGKEQLNKPNNPFNVTSVPEPSMFAAWIVVAIALLFFFIRQRKPI